MEKLTFQSKEECVCPVCDEVFYREELLSGGGRLIAGQLTDELHRLYQPSAKYGDVYPLVYQVTVCPKCWFASMDKDFNLLPRNACFAVDEDEHNRKDTVRLIFPKVNFYENRDIISGTASYYLVLRCYDYYGPKFSPTIKQGIASLRAAWLFEELHQKQPGQNYDWLATLFKRKAQFLYDRAVVYEQSGQESLSAMRNLGPDTDKNYGYEGVLYLSGILKMKYSCAGSIEQRNESLESTKRTIAKMFGLGKSSKNKPGPLLELAKELYNKIRQELNETDD